MIDNEELKIGKPLAPQSSSELVDVRKQMETKRLKKTETNVKAMNRAMAANAKIAPESKKKHISGWW